jgi:hypothetical protein
VLVEQAIFTSARTQRLDGYQLVATTDGISTADCQSLTQWCPAHDSLSERSAKATSVNFHPLESGNYCISRTMMAGAEYSGRGGGRIFTQCFVMSPKTLGKFSNNPFRVLEAITAGGHINYSGDNPTRLDPFRLVGRASAIDQSLLRKLKNDPRSQRLAGVVATVTNHQAVCIIDERHPDLWLGALFSVLPAACRPQLSFSTGLQFSGRRPFRCQTRRSLESDVRKSSLRNGFALVDIDHAEDTPSEPLQGWALLVSQIIAATNLSIWKRLLRCSMPGLRIEDLDALAHEILHGHSHKHTAELSSAS